MKTAGSPVLSRLAVACGLFALLAAALTAPAAQAARVGILSNNCFQCTNTAAATAADFAAKIPGHTFTGVDTSASVPTLSSLLSAYDALLVFEDGRIALSNSKAVGDVAEAFANSGRAVVLGSFYDQDRSDVVNLTLPGTPGGWGALESIDPDTTDGGGVLTNSNGFPNVARVLNAGTMVSHPLTKGVTAFTATSGFAGGNQAKPGTRVLANWTELNAHGLPDPAIAYRITGAACVVQIGIAPDYNIVGVLPGYGNFTGDFYVIWKNAFDFAATSCGTATQIPTLSEGGLAMIVLLIIAIAFSRRRAAVRSR